MNKIRVSCRSGKNEALIRLFPVDIVILVAVGCRVARVGILDSVRFELWGSLNTAGLILEFTHVSL